MTLEWLLLGLLIAAALVPLGLKLRSPRAWAVIGVFLGVTAGGAWAWQNRLLRREQSRAQLAEKIPTPRRHDGYVSSDACQSCHPEQYASWHRSYHRTMTQPATSQSVSGRFDQVTLELAGEKYHLEKRGDEFWADVPDPDWQYVQLLKQKAFESGQLARPPANVSPPRAQKRIGLLTGSHHMQAYWLPGDYGNQQFSLPFTYLFEEARWVPRNDVFLLPPDTPPLQQVWNVNCIRCHATAGQPRQDAHTSVIESRTAELGIACEACHGPADEHVARNARPWRRYALHRQDQPDPTITNPARLPPKKASEACGQCHSIKHINDAADWMAHGFRFRPGGDLEKDTPIMRLSQRASFSNLSAGRREPESVWEGSFWSDGMVRVSGRDYNGMIESPCYQRGDLSCLSCHSMHQSHPNHQLAAGMESNEACYQCHGSFRAKLAQHTRHRAESSGSLCYNCHMPRTTYGLLKAIRSHQIDSPSVASSLQTGRPNACNLCHLDRSLGWTATNLANWYGRQTPPLSAEDSNISAAVLWLLRGDAGQRALLAWHAGWAEAKEASGSDWLAPYLAVLLEDPYSVVRYIGQRSLKRLPGFRDFSYDYIGPAPARREAGQKAMEIWSAQSRTNLPARASVLLEAGGELPREKIAGLLQRRNNRRLELLE